MANKRRNRDRPGARTARETAAGARTARETAAGGRPQRVAAAAARTARGAAAGARPQRVEVVVPDAPGRTEPEPWPRRALMLLAGLALLLQPLAGLLRVLTTHASLAVALLRPDVILIVIAFPVAAPFAQRLTGAGRPLRFLESLSMGAVASIAYDVLGLAGVGLLPPSSRRRGDEPVVLAVSAVAEALAFLVAAAVFPVVQRRLLMPRRQEPRR